MENMKITAQIIQRLQDRYALQEQQIAELSTKLKLYEEHFQLEKKNRFVPATRVLYIS